LVPLGKSDVFAKISNLLEAYSWNNFLQLKVIALYEEMLEHCENNEFRKDALFGSHIGNSLINLANESVY
jgi:hypothetical protein